MDSLTPQQRSEVMRRIKSRNTGPEMVVRCLAHAMGYRYRVHQRKLPGSPDLVFASRGKVIFVHGCFWHLHACPSGQRMPKSNVEFWREKLLRNAARDARNRKELKRLGWGVLTLWSCELKDRQALTRRLRRFLGPAPREAGRETGNDG